MFTGPVGPVEVFFYWPEAVLGNFYWPGAIGSPLASSPVLGKQENKQKVPKYISSVIRNFVFRHFFCHIAPNYGVAS